MRFLTTIKLNCAVENYCQPHPYYLKGYARTEKVNFFGEDFVFFLAITLTPYIFKYNTVTAFTSETVISIIYFLQSPPFLLLVLTFFWHLLLAFKLSQTGNQICTCNLIIDACKGVLSFLSRLGSLIWASFHQLSKFLSQSKYSRPHVQLISQHTQANYWHLQFNYWHLHVTFLTKLFWSLVLTFCCCLSKLVILSKCQKNMRCCWVLRVSSSSRQSVHLKWPVGF